MCGFWVDSHPMEGIRTAKGCRLSHEKTFIIHLHIGIGNNVHVIG
jgi:hypothetical protein